MWSPLWQLQYFWCSWDNGSLLMVSNALQTYSGWCDFLRYWASVVVSSSSLLVGDVFRRIREKFPLQWTSAVIDIRSSDRLSKNETVLDIDNMFPQLYDAYICKRLEDSDKRNQKTRWNRTSDVTVNAHWHHNYSSFVKCDVENFAEDLLVDKQ